MAASTTLDDRIHVRIPADLRARLQSQAAEENLDLADIVRRAVREFVQRNSRRKTAASK